MNDSLIKNSREKLVYSFREQLSEAVANYQINNVSHKPERVTIFVVVGSSKAALKYAQKIESYANKIFINGASYCISFNRESESNPDTSSLRFGEKIIEAVDNASCLHTVENANKVLIAPLFFQDNSDKSSLDKIFEDFGINCKKASEKLKHRNLDVVWLPSLLMFVEYNEVKDDFISRVMNVTKNMEIGFVNAALMLRNRDERRNFEIRRSSLVRTFVMVVALFSLDCDYIVRSDCQCRNYFSASAFSLQMPAHVEILKRVETLLKEFTRKPEDHEERMKAFGNAVSNLPREKIWRTTWEELPIIMGENISIAPIYSFVGCGDHDKDVEYIRSFANKYYISKLPVSKETMEKSASFLNDFWKAYKKNYGGDICGIKNIFEQGKKDDFVEKYIDDLKILNSYDVSGTSYGRSELVSQTVKDECKTIIEILTRRVRDFYYIFLNEENGFVTSICKMHKQAEQFVNDLKDIVNQEITYWQAEEIVHEYLADEFDVTSEMLDKLFDLYLNLLNSNGDSDEVKTQFIKRLFDLAKNGYRVDTNQYLKSFEENYGESNGDTRFVNKCYEKVKKMIPLYNGTSNIEYHIILNDESRSRLFKELCEDKKIKSNGKHIFRNITDRFYIICWTEIVEYKAVKSKPENEGV